MLTRIAVAVVVIGFSAALGAGDVRAQGQDRAGPRLSKGIAELGTFGQYTHFDGNAGCPCNRPLDSWGFGARAGIFVGPRWEPELEVALAGPQRGISGGKIRFSTAGLRVNYNSEVGTRAWLIAGAGAVRTTYDTLNYWGYSGIGGFRIAMIDRVMFRITGVADYMPSTHNLNLSTHVGASIFTGGPRRRGKPLFVAAPSPEPVPVAAEMRPVPPPQPEPVVASIAPAPVPAADTSAFAAPIFFDYNKWTIRPDARHVLDEKVAWLHANPRVRLSIQGRTDPKGTDNFNVVLGHRRAAAARRYLAASGIPADRLAITSSGKDRPTCPSAGDGVECDQFNRRVDFWVVNPGHLPIFSPESR